MTIKTNSLLPTLHITLGPLQLSDLFFNFEHPEYDNSLRGTESYEQARLALFKDAESFLLMLAQSSDPTLAAMLAADFLERL